MRGSETGLLVDAGDEQALALAVLDVIDRPAEALARASRALADVADRFGIERSAETVTGVWEEAAS